MKDTHSPPFARMLVVIEANAPDALLKLCGVSLLERLLRILERLGFREAIIISSTADQIRATIEPPSWARAKVRTRILSAERFQPPPNERILFLPGNIYCDARLISALAQQPGEAALVDADFVSGAGVIDDGNFRSIPARVKEGRIAILNAADVPSYIVSKRRHLRPACFPAPAPAARAEAERLILDTGQPGTLDIPAIIQSPIETWIIRGLCWTSITPNQISLFNILVAFVTTGCFATGHLWLGMIPALAVGVIDGLDGKQARIKIETTTTGKWEHYLDIVYETSWWAALAFWFQRSGQLAHAWLWFLLIMAAYGIDKLAKHQARIRINRLLDDYQPFDRFVRLIGARRDVYIWSLTIGLACGAAAATYRFCAVWGMITAGIHVLRAGMIAARHKIADPSRQTAT